MAGLLPCNVVWAGVRQLLTNVIMDKINQAAASVRFIEVVLILPISTL